MTREVDDLISRAAAIALVTEVADNMAIWPDGIEIAEHLRALPAAAEQKMFCSTCLAFAPDADRTVGGRIWGQCRRQSPAPLPAGVRAKWPEVRPDDWCCEFVAAGTPISVIVNRGDAA